MKSYKEMLDAANAAVPRLTPAQSKEMIANGGVLIVDVRDGTEVAATGKLKGAVHVAAARSKAVSIRNRPTTIQPSNATSPCCCTAPAAAAPRWRERRCRRWATRKCSTAAGSGSWRTRGGVEKG